MRQLEKQLNEAQSTRAMIAAVYGHTLPDTPSPFPASHSKASKAGSQASHGGAERASYGGTEWSTSVGFERFSYGGAEQASHLIDERSATDFGSNAEPWMLGEGSAGAAADYEAGEAGGLTYAGNGLHRPSSANLGTRHRLNASYGSMSAMQHGTGSSSPSPQASQVSAKPGYITAYLEGQVLAGLNSGSAISSLRMMPVPRRQPPPPQKNREYHF